MLTKRLRYVPSITQFHLVVLVDENKTYTWRASRCPEIFREQWAKKKDAYLKSGRWKLASARNTVPMLLIPMPHKPKNAQELRTTSIVDLRERNKNSENDLPGPGLSLLTSSYPLNFPPAPPLVLSSVATLPTVRRPSHYHY
jgi:hypothetical protein